MVKVVVAAVLVLALAGCSAHLADISLANYEAERTAYLKCGIAVGYTTSSRSPNELPSDLVIYTRSLCAPERAALAQAVIENHDIRAYSDFMAIYDEGFDEIAMQGVMRARSQ